MEGEWSPVRMALKARNCRALSADIVSSRKTEMIPFETILKGEPNDSRFEKFCTVILMKSEGITLAPTSVSWDLGRYDVPLSGRPRIYL
jgi:hypothetical protein